MGVNNYQYSGKGLALTESMEGLRLTAYYDQGGVLTNGWGHTGPDVHVGQTVSYTQAVAWLQSDTLAAVNAVNSHVTVPITQAEFDALVDFAFNVGIGAFEGSTLLRALNAGDFAGAEKHFLDWDKSRINGVLQVNPGLFRRRVSEENEFEST